MKYKFIETRFAKEAKNIFTINRVNNYLNISLYIDEISKRDLLFYTLNNKNKS